MATGGEILIRIVAAADDRRMHNLLPGRTKAEDGGAWVNKKLPIVETIRLMIVFMFKHNIDGGCARDQLSCL